MSNHISIQNQSMHSFIPSDDQLKIWADKTMKERVQNAMLCLCIVDKDEITELNLRYRGKDGTTNILSFPFECPEHVKSDMIGDIVICAPVLATEAKAQSKTLLDHWAHMVVHGTLHLLGFTHDDDDNAQRMEATEIKILETFGIANPYLITDSLEHN